MVPNWFRPEKSFWIRNLNDAKLDLRSGAKMKKVDDLEIYQTQIFLGTYVGLTPVVFDFICQEGWIQSIEDDQERGLCFADFEFSTLNLSPDDKSGLRLLDQNTIEKFNELDIRIKNQQTYPYYALDFIDYDEGVVYIIRFKSRFNIDASIN